jgi:hypothetical protein
VDIPVGEARKNIEPLATASFASMDFLSAADEAYDYRLEWRISVDA